MSTLEITVREKRFPAVGEAPALTVFRDLRLAGRRGELICLFGPSGCGKTTLLNIVAGIDRAFEGVVRLPGSGAATGARIGYVFQTPRLLPWRTVEQNVRLVAPEGAAAARIEHLLAETGLAEFRHVYPPRLSVGMRRRAALARAFAAEPDMLLRDEPFVSLDGPTARRLRRLLLDIWARAPTTVLFVTHDLTEAIELADRIIFLSDLPARVVADVPVNIPRDERDTGAVARFRERLAKDGPEGLASLI